MNKHLILIRHAHRDTSKGRELDNGLTSKGEKQAKRLSKYLLKVKHWEKPIELVSSPKRRCQETLAKLSKELELPVKVDERLDELDGPEDREKIEAFLEDFSHGTARTLFVSSHGDWIPLFMQMKFDLYLPLKKGGFVIVELEEGRLEIDSIVQKLPD